jgi:hypothetical protein
MGEMLSAARSRTDGRARRVSILDRPGLPMAVSVGIGPIAPPGADAFRALLRRLAAEHPRHRLFSRLDPQRARWLAVRAGDLDAHCGQMVVESDLRIEEPGPLLARLLAEHGRARPATFVLGRDFLVAVLNHAVGDGAYVNRLVPGLLGAALGGETPGELLAPAMRYPLVRALVGFYGRDPGRLKTLLADPRPSPPVAHEASGRTAPSPRVVSVRSGAGFVATLRERRDLSSPGSSTPAVLFAAARRLLLAEGILDQAGMSVLFDCRRYLPGRNAVEGNFVAGAYILPEDESADSVNGAIRGTIDTGRPLAALAVTAARGALAGRRGDARGDGRSAALSLSHLGRLRAYESLPWRGDEPLRRYVVGTTPRNVDQISLSFGEVGDVLHVSACFDDAFFPEAAVTRVVSALCGDPAATAPHLR